MLSIRAFRECYCYGPVVNEGVFDKVIAYAKSAIDFTGVILTNVTTHIAIYGEKLTDFKNDIVNNAKLLLDNTKLKVKLSENHSILIQKYNADVHAVNNFLITEAYFKFVDKKREKSVIDILQDLNDDDIKSAIKYSKDLAAKSEFYDALLIKGVRDAVKLSIEQMILKDKQKLT